MLVRKGKNSISLQQGLEIERLIRNCDEEKGQILFVMSCVMCSPQALSVIATEQDLELRVCRVMI